jgi:parvulin-like peptidyl-prolyl isomerase
LLATLSSLSLLAAQDSMVSDHAIRYVNQDVITFGDVLERCQNQVQEQTRKGQVTPKSRDEWLVLAHGCLDELTDEALLLQYADELGVRIDRERIALALLDQARSEGRYLSLNEQTRRRQAREKREKINAALGFFDYRTSFITPSTLLGEYRQRQQEFVRPARAFIYQILIRPSDEAQRKALSNEKKQAFKDAQNVVDPAVAEVIGAKLEAYLSASADEQIRILDESLFALAKIQLPADAKDDAVAAVTSAQALMERDKLIKSPQQALAELAALREQLDGKGVDAFKEAARAHSQGPRADLGGELGWIEGGVFAPALDEQVFRLKSGELSPVFALEDVPCLVLVERKDEIAQRSFAEVSGELDRTLQDRRQDEIKKQAVAILRRKAAVTDMVPIEQLFQ